VAIRTCVTTPCVRVDSSARAAIFG